MQSDLLELVNLGNTSINWLRAVGIHSRDELEKTGAVEAYCRIKKRGIRASKVLLYALHGALCDTPWAELTDPVKQELLQAAEQCCEETTN